MATFQSIIDSTRVFLQDDAKTRYTDAQLLDYANEAIGIYLGVLDQISFWDLLRLR